MQAQLRFGVLTLCFFNISLMRILVQGWNPTMQSTFKVKLRMSTLKVNEKSIQNSLVSISKPAIHWTVPGFKVGWRDQNGDWFDEDGPRNGPPQNYWRQQVDEKAYRKDINAIMDSMTSFNITTIQNIERTNRIQKPFLNRKILGTWAPILRNSIVVAFDKNGNVEVPFTIKVQREQGRKLSLKSVYGVFDCHLESGESIAVYSTDGFIQSIKADKENKIAPLDMIGDSLIFLGGITYLSDYLMVQRGPNNGVDLWMRADDSYLGKNNDET